MRFVALVVLAACGGSGGQDAEQGLPRCDTPVSGTRVTARQIGRVASAALLATSPPNDPRLFVLEQGGAIRIFNSDRLVAAPFLDLTPDADGPVRSGGEQGLLGLAFHPRYATNGTFFVFYTTVRPNNMLRDVLARCQVSATDPDRADPASCVEVLSIPDFAANHNGGMIEFGSDGFLYVATGDGGGGGDPARAGQDPNMLLGKMLRLDVDSRTAGEYGIPGDNPFAGGGGAPEVYMLGIRNAWRWTFDRETRDMWIADVGQETIEELTVLRPAEQKGANLGWSMYEGNNCYRQPCAAGAMAFPQHTRTHAEGWVSITGGQVYRGTCYPDLVGWYFFTDYGNGGLSKARLREDGTLEVQDLPGSFPDHAASLHEDARGELYLTNTDGGVYHIEAGP
jgi:glucose/arabinose dehydrogenase